MNKIEFEYDGFTPIKKTVSLPYYCFEYIGEEFDGMYEGQRFISIAGDKGIKEIIFEGLDTVTIKTGVVSDRKLGEIIDACEKISVQKFMAEEKTAIDIIRDELNENRV